jgi:hypothetical protein
LRALLRIAHGIQIGTLLKMHIAKLSASGHQPGDCLRPIPLGLSSGCGGSFKDELSKLCRLSSFVMALYNDGIEWAMLSTDQSDLFFEWSSHS